MQTVRLSDFDACVKWWIPVRSLVAMIETSSTVARELSKWRDMRHTITVKPPESATDITRVRPAQIGSIHAYVQAKRVKNKILEKVIECQVVPFHLVVSPVDINDSYQLTVMRLKVYSMLSFQWEPQKSIDWCHIDYWIGRYFEMTIWLCSSNFIFTKCHIDSRRHA